jgi:SAM-dependent methyltransferase
MAASPRTKPFTFDDAEILRLRNALVAGGFTEQAIVNACGVRTLAELASVSPEVALQRTAQQTPLDVLVRLFVIGVAVPAPAATKVLGLPFDRLLRGGLLREGKKDVRAAVRMVAFDGVLTAFDREFEGDKVEAPDFVMGPSESARKLATLMINSPCEDALDLGSGCGLLAFLAARHSNRVVATDLNARAAAFASFNAKLNGLPELESFAGDLFAPVAGRTFDLIISNPPFVISPEDRLTYLNGGMKADGFCERLAREAPAYLREGGHLQMLCNWIELDGEEWGDRLEGWFEGSGCDVWVMRTGTTEPEEYARGWMNVGHIGGSTDPKRLQAWLDYYEQERIGAIGAGLITMRKRAGNSWFRAFDGPVRVVPPAGEAIVERMRVLDVIAPKSDEQLLDAVLKVNPDVHLTQDLQPTTGGWAQVDAHLRLSKGLAYVEAVDIYVGHLVGACNGSRTVKSAIAHAAEMMDWAPSDIPSESVGILRQLVEEGFLSING